MPIYVGSGAPSPATYTLLLNGVDVSANFVQDSWSVTQSFGRQGSTATLYLVDDFGATPGAPTLGANSPPLPQVLQSVKLTDTSISQTLFAGTTKTPILQPVGPTVHNWELDCLDYTDYLDNIIVNGDFIGFTADQIVEALAGQNNLAYSSTNTRGLLTTNVNPAPMMQRLQINYVSLSTALTKLARLSSLVTDYGWFVDYNYGLHFFSYLQAATPVVTFTDDFVANPTTTLGTYANDSTFAYEWDGGSVRNSCIVRGSNYTGAHVDSFTGDNVTTSWPISLAMDTTTTGTLTVSGVAQAVTTVTPTTILASVTTPYIVTQNANGRWYLQTNRSTAAPAIGASIVFAYHFIAPIIVRVDNPSSQALYTQTAGPNNFGVFQMSVTDSTLTSLSAVSARGKAELQAFQWPQERVTFTTSENWPGHVNAGDMINFRTSRIPNSQNNFSIAPWTGQFLIVSNTYQGVPGNYRNYTLTATRVS